MSVNLARVNVLLVDDNRSMRALVKQILHAFGVKNIHECSSGLEAMEELKLFPADVVIADWVMEPLDGLHLVREIRTSPDSPNSYVPIIMLTGHTELRRVEEARDAGVTEFLAKPITAQAVYQRLIQIIDRPRPFLKTEKFTGPDRRRTEQDLPQGMRSRRKADAKNENASDGDGDNRLSQEDVDKIIDD
ncbi:MAG: response regulator [Alphaproteobacteria bacterium]